MHELVAGDLLELLGDGGGEGEALELGLGNRSNDLRIACAEVGGVGGVGGVFWVKRATVETHRSRETRKQPKRPSLLLYLPSAARYMTRLPFLVSRGASAAPWKGDLLVSSSHMRAPTAQQSTATQWPVRSTISGGKVR